MIFALGAGKLFDIHHSGEFEETILGESCYYCTLASTLEQDIPGVNILLVNAAGRRIPQQILLAHDHIQVAN